MSETQPEKSAQSPAPAAPAASVKSRLPWIYRWENNAKVAGRGLIEIFKSTRSADRPTRRMALIFIVSLVTSITVMIAGVRHIRHLRQLRAEALGRVHEDAEKLSAFFERQASDAKKKYSTTHLGKYFIELKMPSGLFLSKKHPPLAVAEVEIIAECDRPVTCDYLEDHLTQVKDALTNAIGPIDRDEILAKEGKDHLKKTLLDHLNSWLESRPDYKPEGTGAKPGGIRNLYFPKFVLS